MAGRKEAREKHVLKFIGMHRHGVFEEWMILSEINRKHVKAGGKY